MRRIPWVIGRWMDAATTPVTVWRRTIPGPLIMTGTGTSRRFMIRAGMAPHPMNTMRWGVWWAPP